MVAKQSLNSVKGAWEIARIHHCVARSKSVKVCNSFLLHVPKQILLKPNWGHGDVGVHPSFTLWEAGVHPKQVAINCRTLTPWTNLESPADQTQAFGLLKEDQELMREWTERNKHVGSASSCKIYELITFYLIGPCVFLVSETVQNNNHFHHFLQPHSYTLSSDLLSHRFDRWV